jgi:hypothetical protein
MKIVAQLKKIAFGNGVSARPLVIWSLKTG